MKKALLASTALAGASLMATSAMAAAPVTKSDLEVTISGTVRFIVPFASVDIDSGGAASGDRGFEFSSDESEIVFQASGVSDGGISYGLVIEQQTQTNDTDNADETYIFFEDDTFGRLEIGDQDGAFDRMFRGAKNVQAGRGGFDGPAFNLASTGAALRTGPSPNFVGDATKIIYFTPRFSGVQLGASYTPDSNDNGGATSDASDGGFQDVIDLGINYVGDFGDTNVTFAAVAEFSDHEDPTTEGVENYSIGGTVSFAGFSVGAHYQDLGDTGITDAAAATGADAGNVWDVGAGYSSGPWAVGIGALFGENGNAANAGDSDVEVYTINGTYNFAPGLDIKADLNFIDIDNPGTATDNEGTTGVLAIQADF